MLRRLRINKEKWLREISFGFLSFFIAYIFFYLTTHKRPPLTFSFAAGVIAVTVVTHLVLKQSKWAILLILAILPFYPFVRIQVLRFKIVGGLVGDECRPRSTGITA